MPNLNDLVNHRNDDEFYTMYSDVVLELSHYSFRNQSVLLPCDGLQSSFWKYFYNNFESLGLTHLTAVSFIDRMQYDYDGTSIVSTSRHDPSFLSADTDRLACDADWIITNPPFSINSELGKWLKLTGKKFVVLLHFLHWYYSTWRTFNLGFTIPSGDYVRPNGTVYHETSTWITNQSTIHNVPVVDSFTNLFDLHDYHSIQVGICKTCNSIPFTRFVRMPAGFMEQWTISHPFRVLNMWVNDLYTDGSLQFGGVLIEILDIEQ